MKIAFFDSGLGGLSVLHRAMQMLPDEEFLFFADEDHVPYGLKTRAEIKNFVAEAFDFIVQQGVKAIVVACNTATSVAVRDMRQRYDVPIIGMEPAAKLALDRDPVHRVIVTATNVTVRGDKLHDLLVRYDQHHLIDLNPLQELVTFAEREEFTSPAVIDYLRGEFSKYDLSEYSAVVLGCTHFNYFKDTMRALLPDHMQILDGNEGTVRELIRQLQAAGQLAGPREGAVPPVDYYYSGRHVTDPAELARLGRFLKRLDEVDV